MQSPENKPVYVIIGTREEVGQVEIGGGFVTHYTKEIVGIFRSEEKAQDFIKRNALKKPRKETFSGAKYYKTGHYSLEIEEHYINE